MHLVDVLFDQNGVTQCSINPESLVVGKLLATGKVVGWGNGKFEVCAMPHWEYTGNANSCRKEGKNLLRIPGLRKES